MPRIKIKSAEEYYDQAQRNAATVYANNGLSPLGLDAGNQHGLRNQ